MHRISTCFFALALLTAAFSSPVVNGAQSAPSAAGSGSESLPAVIIEHLSNTEATALFSFRQVRRPGTNDAGALAAFLVIDGEKDPNSGGLTKLNDGKLPRAEDDPGENFFFEAGSQGGRLRIDLGEGHTLKEVNTYSWHPNTRAAQVYSLYVSDGEGEGFVSDPKAGVNPSACGWRFAARVDTRPKAGETGGQYGVSIRFNGIKAFAGARYLLMVFEPTEMDDDFGNTFYSEIDVIVGDVKQDEEAS